MSRLVGVLASIGLFVAAAAQAGPHWQVTTFSITPQNLPTVIAASEKFMASETGKAMPGTLSFMARTIDGTDPATHGFISSMDSLAERETWVRTLGKSADWAEFLDTVSKHATLRGTYRMNFVKSYGEEGADDEVWELYLAKVKNAKKYAKALDRLMSSEATKDFPGSMWLSSMAAAGISPVSHVVSVGYESEAEAEAWSDELVTTEEWAAFMEAVGEASEFQGTILLRTLKQWGPPAQP